MNILSLPSLADYLPLDTIFGKGGEDPELHMVEVDDPASILDGYASCFDWLAQRLSFWYRDKYYTLLPIPPSSYGSQILMCGSIVWMRRSGDMKRNSLCLGY